MECHIYKDLNQDEHFSLCDTSEGNKMPDHSEEIGVGGDYLSEFGIICFPSKFYFEALDSFTCIFCYRSHVCVVALIRFYIACLYCDF